MGDLVVQMILLQIAAWVRFGRIVRGCVRWARA
jgi:hypothetical protein